MSGVDLGERGGLEVFRQLELIVIRRYQRRGRPPSGRHYPGAIQLIVKDGR